MTPPIGLAMITVGQLMLSGVAIWLMRKLKVFDVKDFKFKELKTIPVALLRRRTGEAAEMAMVQDRQAAARV
jgi:hypothetical protein